MEDDIVYLCNWLGEMADELADAKLKARNDVKAAKKAVRSAKKIAADLTERRLDQLKDLKVRVGELQDDLAEESQQCAALLKLSNILLEIKREQQVGRQGGSAKWPL